MPDRILISEIFGPTIQGEGPLAGQTSHFIRTAGCAYYCTWCDSMYAVDPALIKQSSERLTQPEIVDRIRELPSARWVTLSGGDPVAWDLPDVCVGLHALGYRIAVETQGALWRDWLTACDQVTCSPKPPSSGMENLLSIPTLQKYVSRLEERLTFKFVVFNEEDLLWVHRIRTWLGKNRYRGRFYLSAGTPLGGGVEGVLTSTRWLVQQVLKHSGDFKDYTVLPQLHVLLWNGEKGR